MTYDYPSANHLLCPIYSAAALHQIERLYNFNFIIIIRLLLRCLLSGTLATSHAGLAYITPCVRPRTRSSHNRIWRMVIKIIRCHLVACSPLLAAIHENTISIADKYSDSRSKSPVHLCVSPSLRDTKPILCAIPFVVVLSFPVSFHPLLLPMWDFHPAPVGCRVCACTNARSPRDSSFRPYP